MLKDIANFFRFEADINRSNDCASCQDTVQRICKCLSGHVLEKPGARGRPAMSGLHYFKTGTSFKEKPLTYWAQSPRRDLQGIYPPESMHKPGFECAATYSTSVRRAVQKFHKGLTRLHMNKTLGTLHQDVQELAFPGRSVLRGAGKSRDSRIR